MTDQPHLIKIFFNGYAKDRYQFTAAGAKTMMDQLRRRGDVIAAQWFNLEQNNRLVDSFTKA